MSKKVVDPDYEIEALKYAKPIPSRRFILNVIVDHNEPIAFKRLAKELELDSTDLRQALKSRLRAMVREGQLVVDGRNAFTAPSKTELIRGRVVGHANGSGTLIPDQGKENIFLSPREMQSAFDGDIAEARILRRDRRGRSQGHLVEVVQQNTKTVLGRLYRDNLIWMLDSVNPRITQKILVNETGLEQEGLIVYATIIKQPGFEVMATCQIKEVLGHQLSTEVKIAESLRNSEIPRTFSETALSDAANLELQSFNTEFREDLRAYPFITIDGEDAKDFDDAIYCEQSPDEGWRLLVAIADVAHYVTEGSSLDKNAFERGTSVYFPGTVIPMLPMPLSNGLCSLKPGVDRLVLVCDIRISNTGSVREYQFYEGVICSTARLTYDQVAAGFVAEPWEKSLFSAKMLVSKLLVRRKKRGALDFETSELDFTFDKDGNISSINQKSRNDAMQLIEECMLCANVCAAKFIDDLKLKGLYRVHERPDEKKIFSLRKFLNSLNVTLPDGLPSPVDLQGALDQLNKKPNGQVLQLAILRSLSQAKYELRNAGHYGLNFPMYTHFTSPIRRYPDLVTHRLIKSIIHSTRTTSLVKRVVNPSYTEQSFGRDGLDIIAEHCSFTERRAEKAVYEVLEWMKCDYIAGEIGQTADGIITHVTNFGFFVQLTKFYVEGMVHVSNLINDYYHFEQDEQCLIGKRSGIIFGIGDSVSVKIARVNSDERKIDLEIISHDPLSRRVSSKRQSHSKNRRYKGKRK